MKKVIFSTTLLVVLFFIPISANAGVIINEIAWMGTDVSSNDEWIELYSDEEVDLAGWTLEAVDGSPLINLQGTISANGYFLLERTDDTSVPDITADQIYTGALSNSGEYLKLKDASNNVIDEIDASDGWPAGDNSTKQTMERTATGWQTSLDPEGTPKAQNSSGAIEEPEKEMPSSGPTNVGPTKDAAIGNELPIAIAGNDIIGFIGQEIKFNGTKSSDPNGYELSYSWNMGNGELIEKDVFTYKYLYQGTYLVTLMVYNGHNYAWDTIAVKIQNQEITINEFIPNPIGKDEENEWIEIYNDSNSIVDISGWQLDDVDGGSKPFTFPENTLIAPKNYLVFPRTITDLALNNTSDSVRLLLPEGIVFQEVNYEDCKEGQSSARTDQGFVWAVPTPGLANIVSIPKAVGGEKEISYQYEPEKQTVKEYTSEYTAEYIPPEQSIKGGYTTQEIAKENDLAMIEPLLAQDQLKGTQSDTTKTNQTTTNLILMIIIVILTATIIGLFLAKFLKPKNPLT